VRAFKEKIDPTPTKNDKIRREIVNEADKDGDIIDRASARIVTWLDRFIRGD
jgi:hypothetical protein